MRPKPGSAPFPGLLTRTCGGDSSRPRTSRISCRFRPYGPDPSAMSTWVGRHSSSRERKAPRLSGSSPGAGKSVLLATLVLQFRRYPQARILVFDKGRSVRATVLGLAGEHYDLGCDGAI